MLRKTIAIVGRNIANVFRNASTEPETLRWTIHDSNLALFECLSRANSKRPALPAEIIMLILADPSRWIETSRESFPHQGSPAGTSFIEGTDIYPIIKTRAFSAREAAGLRRIVFTFCTQDQGWSSYPEHHGTYNQSYTWMETGISEDDGSAGTQRWELQRNRHAGQRPEYYNVELDQNHELIGMLEQGDGIGMWARARFPGWTYRVFGANIELVFYGIDSLED